MWHSDFQYYAAVESADGESIADLHLDVDWIPALRWAEFEQSMQTCLMPSERSSLPVIEPIWSPESGAPYLTGVMVRLDAQETQSVSFPLSYFSDATTKASNELLASGALLAGQTFEYKIYALVQAQPLRPVGCEINVVALDALPSFQRAELAPLMEQVAVHINTVTGNSPALTPASTMPILIPQSVFDEATELARNVGDVESGGILVGSLCRDPDGTYFSKVSAQIPAEHTTATRESLRFTPESWVAVDAAIKLRNLGEITLGWWHSHPWWCRKCRSEERLRCPFSIPSFSLADRGLHREVFQKSWSMALLLSFLGGEQPGYDVFGWNQGQIEALPFTTLPDKATSKEIN